MGKTIKAKDLLIKILKEEDVPKQIKYKGEIYTFYKNSHFKSSSYKKNGEKGIGLCLDAVFDKEVELIEEDKEIELEHIEEIDINLGILNMTPTEKHISNYVNQLIKNQKTLIKLVNELKKEGK